MDNRNLIILRFIYDSNLPDIIRTENKDLIQYLKKYKGIPHQEFIDLLNVDKSYFSKKLHNLEKKRNIFERVSDYFPFKVWIEIVIKREGGIKMINSIPEPILFESQHISQFSVHYEEMSDEEYVNRLKLRDKLMFS